MKLKICGVRNVEMLDVCQNGNVDYVGINFVATSKRQVQSLSKPRPEDQFKRVGIFVGPTLDEIQEAIKNYDLDVIQLHGNEDVSFIDTCLDRFTDIKVWKALTVDENLKSEVLQQYCNKCELVLFDGQNPGSGNTIVDQQKLRDAIIEAQSYGAKVGLAGGIKAHNIRDFKQKIPNLFLLDTASGVERDGQFSVDETKTLINNFNA